MPDQSSRVGFLMSANDRSYQETIDYLYGLQKHGVKLGMSNTIALMEALGNPQKRFPSAHVAGTNGKGSTCAFLCSMLAAAGYRVGLYTSPHLVSFTERIRINGIPITESKVVELGRRVREACRTLASPSGSAFNPTFFEVTTAIAFSYFSEEAVDFAVVEVGMGGRLDATNVIMPLVSVITNIDLEHTEFLGDTLELITAEKAGIIKPGVPVVSGVSQPEVVHLIKKASDAAGSPLSLLARDFKPGNIRSGKIQRFDYQGRGISWTGLAIELSGRYQVDNACLALAAVEWLRETGMPVNEAAVRRGLEEARWEGRLERVSKNPDIYLDGAHNPASARMLAGALKELRSEYRQLVLIIGILGDKDFRGIVSELLPLADRVIVTKPDYSRAMDVALLAKEVRSLHGAVDSAESVVQAIEKAKAAAGGDDLIVITGSLYVVGDARAAVIQGPSPALSNLKG